MNLLIKLKREKAFVGSNYVVLHLGGNSWKERELSINVWYEVVRFLLNKNYKVIVVGKEGDLCTPVTNDNFFNLIDKLTLSEIHQLIMSAKMFIGIDSGILHIAQCTNTKLIGIFTCVDPKTRIFRQHYTKSVVPTSECKFCLTYKIKPPVTKMKCETGTLECCKSITSKMIIKAVKEINK